MKFGDIIRQPLPVATFTFLVVVIVAFVRAWVTQRFAGETLCDPCAHECDDHDHEEREGRYGKRLPDDVAEFHTQTKVAKNDEWSQIIRNFVPPRIHLRGDRKMLETCYQYERIEAGCDEAGRGCLAGAVFAAAVILPPDFHDPLLNDSKQMSERNRDRLRPIIEREAVAWAVAAVPPERIDEINILNASFEGMCRAVGELRTRPEFLAIDGNRFRSSLDIPYRCIVKGDGKYADIAAASVLAKTHRDEYMRRLAEEFPQYGWAKNKGYPTREHRLAVRRYGVTPYHRLTFNHESGQLELF